MGIEVRRNGNLYYYEKRREGGRVVSQYVGGGIIADLAQRRAQIEKQQKEIQRERLRLSQMRAAEVERQLDTHCKVIDQLMTAHLLTLGFHQHKRQWRRRRDGTE